MKLKYKQVFHRLIAVGALLLAVLLLTSLKRVTVLSEYVFSRGISRAYVFVAGHIADCFPFSIFEIAAAVFFLCVIILIIKWIVLLKRKRAALAARSVANTLIVVFTVLTAYTATASMCYFREPLPVPKYEGEQLSSEVTAEMLEYYLQDFEFVTNVVNRDSEMYVSVPYTDEQIAELLVAEYGRIGTFDGYLSGYTPLVKPVAASELMSYMNITGVTFSVTGEANVNANCPTLYKVHTCAHELAHIKGVMNEDEANLLAYYLLLTADDIYLRYAGYLYSFDRLYDMGWYSLDEQTLKEYKQRMPRLAIRDAEREYAYWTHYDTLIDKISDIVNDVYLKSSGVDDGTDSYVDSTDYDIVVSDDGEITRTLNEYSLVQKMMIRLFFDKNPK